MGKFIDLTGQKFSRLTVIKRAPNRKDKVFWLCQCDCGNIVEVRSDQLRRGIARSCGCLAKDATRELGYKNFKDLTGQKFGKLTAISPVFNEKTKKYSWICKCDCGNIKTILGTSLTSGNTRSCGCVKSFGERNIAQILQENNINYIPQYYINIDEKRYYYDFAIVENNKVVKFIEFDGPQHEGRISGWFTPERYEQLQQNDAVKNNYAKEKNIKLYRIPYSQKDNLTLEEIFNKKYLVNNKENVTG